MLFCEEWFDVRRQNDPFYNVGLLCERLRPLTPATSVAEQWRALLFSPLNSVLPLNFAVAVDFKHRIMQRVVVQKNSNQSWDSHANTQPTYSVHGPAMTVPPACLPWGVDLSWYLTWNVQVLLCRKTEYNMQVQVMQITGEFLYLCYYAPLPEKASGV